eukprot:symbB.v1.2.012394.t1/scaffold857.1/size218589/9
MEEEHRQLFENRLPLQQFQKLMGAESLEMFPAMHSLGHPFTRAPCRRFLGGNFEEGALICDPMLSQCTTPLISYFPCEEWSLLLSLPLLHCGQPRGLHSPKAEFSCGQVHGDELFGWTSNRRIHRIGNLSGCLPRFASQLVEKNAMHHEHPIRLTPIFGAAQSLLLSGASSWHIQDRGRSSVKRPEHKELGVTLQPKELILSPKDWPCFFLK